MSAKVQHDKKSLHESAVSFLSDPSVKDAPLTQKLEFLRSKGLTQQEIESALKQSQESNRPSLKAQFQNDSALKTTADRGDPTFYEAVPPPLPRRDWKDYFIMATATIGLFYGVYEVTKRYVIPNLLPESQSKLEQDKKEIQDQFEKVDTLLETLQNEQSEFKQHENEKLAQLDKILLELRTCLDQTSYTRNKIEDEFKIMKLEVTNLRNKLDTFVTSRKGDQQLENITSEFESLKQLIKMASPENSVGGSKDSTDRKKSPVPGVEAIPSAEEILSKMNFGNNNNSNSGNETQQQEQDSIPAWKKAREESLSRSDSNTIPEWQRSSSSNRETPQWQNAITSIEQESIATQE